MQQTRFRFAGGMLLQDLFAIVSDEESFTAVPKLGPEIPVDFAV